MSLDITGNYVVVRVKNPSAFDKNTFSIVELSSEKGIKTLIGKLKEKSGENDSTEIRSYLFDSSKWSVSDARAWIKENDKDAEEIIEETKEDLIREIEFKQDDETIFKGFIKAAVDAVNVDNEEDRIIEGYVSKIGEDRTKDYVHPEAFTKTMEKFMDNPVLTYMHDWSKPIGKILEYKIDDVGLWIKCQITKGVEWADDAWTLIKDGVLKAFSYAFRAKDSKKVKGVNHIYELEILECSVVSVPMHSGALFTISGKGMKTEMIDEYATRLQEITEKAVWSTAFVNNLPDSSFAYVENGGEKDDEGKTKPRSLRHLPYKDAEGNIDKAHVRNALARISQTDISDEAKANAKRKLVSAAKKVGVDVSEEGKSAENIEDLKTKQATKVQTDTIGKFKISLTSEIINKVNSPEELLDTITPWNYGGESASVPDTIFTLSLSLDGILLRTWTWWDSIDANVGYQTIKQKLTDKFGSNKSFDEEVVLKYYKEFGMKLSDSQKADLISEQNNKNLSQNDEELLLALKNAKNEIVSMIEILRTNRR